MKRSLLATAPAVAVLGLTLLGVTAQTAAAAAPHPAAPKGGAAPVAGAATPSSPKTSSLPGAQASILGGYRQVTSALLTDPAGTQVSGSVSCPAQDRLVGGGAVISSSSLGENLNASVPLTDGLTWKVYVNNSSSTAGTFRVYADCVRKVNDYSVVVGTGVSNPAGTQTSASVTCPVHTFPLGGGGFASSGSTAVNINTSIPLTNGWRTDINNASTSSDTATAYVVCGRKPTGYVQVSGTSATVNAGSQTHATVTCPTGTSVLGGGAYSSTGSTLVDLNSSVPSGKTAWISYENNASSAANSLTAYAVCAQTT